MNTADDIDTLQIGPDPDKLERFHRQQLSTMLDGELSQDQARFLRRRLEHDAELSGCFERWQVCGDVLRGRQVSLLPPDFADRIARGIAAGDVVIAPVTSAKRPRFLRWGGGAALAASVALVALFVGRPGASFDDTDDVLPMVADAAPIAPAIPSAHDATADASALVAASPLEATAAVAGAAALAVAEVPRRGNGDRASRGQSQRAALRNTQTRQVSEARMVASAAPPRPAVSNDAAAARALASTSAIATGLPEAPAVSRPWPKASSLSANSSFSVRYGDAFAAPSWDAPQASGSHVLPSFPVDPADAARPQLRAVP
ncbi:sigma-E factor negative regulatory protein [Luteimonas fraxinea]|uniref:Sigma-E factor negative regulatory protein n=1 Tax=Luteimonas fraxinea TaxID=2901869 RepID=A0ABS8UA14_9GAMM|nr:sigma-E factor negative regulatory protein [Luteimonas fraxinea]MCD9096327.1 sigma-E factor negative regulatory protein [Luteimonas fraxinea]MCD9125670.1 sigma-E factor negative regulatory protein [Luteimonas fraxinea]UHH10295.1 sigma-E factor negative regulatory protein [Luteimonas fraxinea]